jgi:hypothetical protein
LLANKPVHLAFHKSLCPLPPVQERVKQIDIYSACAVVLYILAALRAASWWDSYATTPARPAMTWCSVSSSVFEGGRGLFACFIFPSAWSSRVSHLLTPVTHATCPPWNRRVLEDMP